MGLMRVVEVYAADLRLLMPLFERRKADYCEFEFL